MSSLASRSLDWDYWALHEWSNIRLIRVWVYGKVVIDRVTESRGVAIAVRPKGQQGLCVHELARHEHLGLVVANILEKTPRGDVTSENWFLDLPSGVRESRIEKSDVLLKDLSDLRFDALWNRYQAGSEFPRHSVELDIELSVRKDSEGSQKILLWKSRALTHVG